jgi:hypothetical protein
VHGSDVQEEDGDVQIEVFYIPDCPSWSEAGRRVREALALTGRDRDEIHFRLLNSVEDAALLPFSGSPTILMDGSDLFPGGERTSQLACRVYATPNGLSGTPTMEQIIDAMDARGL